MYNSGMIKSRILIEDRFYDVYYREYEDGIVVEDIFDAKTLKRPSDEVKLITKARKKLREKE